MHKQIVNVMMQVAAANKSLETNVLQNEKFLFNI